MAWIEQKRGKYLVRWREPDGRTRSELTRTKDEARAVKARVESELLSGAYVSQDDRKQAFAGYAAEVLLSDLSLEESTRYQQERLFARWIEPYLGRYPIGAIDAAVIRRAFAQMLANGASESQVGRVRAVAGKVFRRAISEGILTRNPVASVPAPKTETREIRVLTPEEVSAVAEAHPARYRMMPLLSAWGTLRIGEVAAMNTEVIDGDVIHVRRSVATAGSTVYLKGPKTAASRRSVRLPAWLAGELREHALRYRNPDGFIFTSERGNLLSHITYHPIWQRALRDVGFPKPWPRPHDLRHTAVSLMIRAGADPKQIQARCGHSKITETFDTYGHLFPGHDDQLIAALEEFRPQEGRVIEL